MSSMLVTTRELRTISPTLLGQPIMPDEVTVVPIYTDINTVTDDDFYTTPTLDGSPAVWVRGLTAGQYKVICRMDDQPDTQRPIWELDGTIVVTGRA